MFFLLTLDERAEHALETITGGDGKYCRAMRYGCGAGLATWGRLLGIVMANDDLELAMQVTVSAQNGGLVARVRVYAYPTASEHCTPRFLLYPPKGCPEDENDLCFSVDPSAEALKSPEQFAEYCRELADAAITHGATRGLPALYRNMALLTTCFKEMLDDTAPLIILPPSAMKDSAWIWVKPAASTDALLDILGLEIRTCGDDY